MAVVKITISDNVTDPIKKVGHAVPEIRSALEAAGLTLESVELYWPKATE
jgi:hypothetical protein